MILQTGEKMQMYGPQLMDMLRDGLVVKTGYEGFLNNEVVSVAYVDQAGWRPVGKREIK